MTALSEALMDRGFLGQDEARTFLKRACQEGRVGHAYLFCGPVGTGKLDCAIAFAQAVVCANGGCGLCEDCHVNLEYIVHHTVELNHNNYKDPDISLNHDRLKYVCKKCHDKEHGYCDRERNPKRVIFDSNGDVIPVFVAENDEI